MAPGCSPSMICTFRDNAPAPTTRTLTPFRYAQHLLLADQRGHLRHVAMVLGVEHRVPGVLGRGDEDLHGAGDRDDRLVASWGYPPSRADLRDKQPGGRRPQARERPKTEKSSPGTRGTWFPPIFPSGL